jgi:Big-like domain-containing protein
VSYPLRVALVSLTLAALTAVAILFAPKATDIRIVAQAPNGGNIALDSAISVTFSRPVERRSAERAFLLYPPAKGRFVWRDQTLMFQLTEALRPQTGYRVTIRPGVRDTYGYINRFETSWPFRTR